MLPTHSPSTSVVDSLMRTQRLDYVLSYVLAIVSDDTIDYSDPPLGSNDTTLIPTVKQ